MPVEKTIIEVWSGDEPVNTGHGPIYYHFVRFAEDPDKVASIGCKEPNIVKVRDKLNALLESKAEFELALNKNGNFKILDYPGKYQSTLRVLEEGRGVASNPQPQSRSATSSRSSGPPSSSVTDVSEELQYLVAVDDRINYVIALAEEHDHKLDTIISMLNILLMDDGVELSGGEQGDGEAPAPPANSWAVSEEEEEIPDDAE